MKVPVGQVGNLRTDWQSVPSDAAPEHHSEVHK